MLKKIHFELKEMQNVVKNIPQCISKPGSVFCGSIKDIRNDSKSIEIFEKFQRRRQYSVHNGKVDWQKRNLIESEHYDIILKFFWGMTGGTVIELGALDGDIASESRPLHNLFGWNRILVEANPFWSDQLAKMSPDAYSIGAGICASDSKIVHYIMKDHIGGIVEFMDSSFLKVYHKELYGLYPNGNWTALPYVREIRCVPLGNVLKHANISHVNVFILDTEGAELSVLKSINFSEVRFDVLVIETDTVVRPPSYEDTVTKFLAPHGYVRVPLKHLNNHRNTWYRHATFRPTVCEKSDYIHSSFDYLPLTVWTSVTTWTSLDSPSNTVWTSLDSPSEYRSFALWVMLLIFAIFGVRFVWKRNYLRSKWTGPGTAASSP